MSNSDPESHSSQTEAGWIALAPSHLLPWLLLASGLLGSLVFATLPYGFQGRFALSWGFTLLHWVLGALACAAALQPRPEASPGALRQTARGLALAGFGLRLGTSLALQFGSRMGLSAYSLWAVSQVVCTLLGLTALILLLVGRQEDAGARFDGAVAALAMAGGAAWLALPVLALGALRGHPLLAALWQALREPKAALEGAWFDGLDAELRQGNLGACALALALSFLGLAGRLLLAGAFGHQMNVNLGWGLTDLAATLLASLLLGLHVVLNARRTGQRTGRVPALVAILLSGLPLLLLLAAAVFLALILTDVIHFRWF